MVKMAASDDDSRSEVSEILASCDNTSPKKKDIDQNSETSSDPFEVCIMKSHYSHYTYKESPRGAASGLSRRYFFRLQTSLLSLFLVQMG